VREAKAAPSRQAAPHGNKVAAFDLFPKIREISEPQKQETPMDTKHLAIEHPLSEKRGWL
jgi:hypothetical protein